MDPNQRKPSLPAPTRPRACLLGAIASCFGLATTAQAEVVPVTSELLVSDAGSAPTQHSVIALARAGDGSALVAWTVTSGGSTPQSALYLRRYNAQGLPQAAPYKLASVEQIDDLAVAMNPAGSAVVAWSTSSYPQKPLATNTAVHAQRINSAGAPQGGEIDIARFKGIASVDVAMDKTGDFALSWGHSVGVFGLYGYTLYKNSVHVSTYGASGTPRVTGLLVNDPEHTLGGKPYVTASVAMDEDGDFAVAWDSARGFVRAQPPTRGSVQMRRYSRYGLPQGAELQVDEFKRSQGLDLIAMAPSVAMDAAGNTSVAWSAAGMLVSRFYDTHGKTAAPRFYPSIDGAGYRGLYPARIVRAASGRSLLSWSQVDDAYGIPSTGTAHAEAQLYDADGMAVGAPFAIGSAMLNAPTVALDGGAAPAAAWITPDYELHLQFYAAP